jgi:hypothetical protein
MEYLTTPEAAELLRRSVQTLQNWRGRRQGPPWSKIGRSVVYPASGLAAFVQRGMVDPEGVSKAEAPSPPSTSEQSRADHSKRSAMSASVLTPADKGGAR